MADKNAIVYDQSFPLPSRGRRIADGAPPRVASDSLPWESAQRVMAAACTEAHERRQAAAAAAGIPNLYRLP